MTAPPPSSRDGALAFVEVAVPVPFADTLVYRVPPHLAALVADGVRVRVPVGRRVLVGCVVSRREGPPADIDEIREVLDVLDLAPAVPADLLALGRFAADYYLAPLGEVLRSFLPAQLPPWGSERLWLTDRGALAAPRDPVEAAVVELLRGGEPWRAAAIRAQVASPELPAVLARMREEGRLAWATGEGSRTRYRPAFELAPGDRDAQRTLAGRSRAALETIDYLAALGRPATGDELHAATGVSPAALRRLAERGVLHRFSQPERLDLSRHVMAPQREETPFALRSDQDEALRALETALRQRAFARFLLAGVTGSGKSEVFLRAAERCLAADRGAILLVPEISLVPALARQARARFGPQCAILHSGLGEAERAQEWERVRHGEARLVLGPRSALFAPVADLGLVVVDEEHDPAYKQDSTPRYHGRDLALVRAQAASAVAVLVSATPSLETRRNVALGRSVVLRLDRRAGPHDGAPRGILVDLRGEAGRQKAGEVAFSAVLLEEIEKALAAGEQTILLRNRRGYAPVLLCRACGEDFRCQDCGLPRTMHRRPAVLLCHYCGSRLPIPSRCPACDRETLEPLGAGTERVEEEVRRLFPGARVDVLDRDTVRQRGSVAAVLERFAGGAIDILVGTQMVSKGHHFPGVALTGVLSADSYLSFPDFRAVERTYSLLTQVAGRSGRGARPGRWVLQTHHPQHHAIRAALEGDDAAFEREEMRFRHAFHYPPFTRMILVLARDRRREAAESALQDLAAALARGPQVAGLRTTGPAPAPFERLRGEWRFQLILRAPSGAALRAALRQALPRRSPVDLTIDVDPQHLL